MIRQHYLQQQRLNHNHDRLLQRYQRLLTPTVSQFPAFGTSSLPGRNYEAYLDRSEGPSLAVLSRAAIGSSSEIYRWMGDGAVESLPRNVSTVMQHSRQQAVPLVHAEKFEPVQVYEHPIFGPTPAYIRPVVSENVTLESLDDELEDRPSTPPIEQKGTPIVHQDEDEEEKSLPAGYISYKKWKAKHENLIPVNPLLFNIYTRRSNGSIHSYGQSLYATPSHAGRERRDSDDLDEASSTRSETPVEPTLSTTHQYHRLKSPTHPSTLPSRSTTFVPEEPDDLFTNDNGSSRDSPVPYFSRSRSPALPSVNLPINPPPVNTTGTGLASSTIPAAPPVPASLISSTSSPMYQTPASITTTSNSVGIYQAPSSLSFPNPAAPKVVTFGASSSIPPPPPPVADVSSSSSDSDDDDEKKKRRRRKKRQAAGLDAGDSSSSDD